MTCCRFTVRYYGSKYREPAILEGHRARMRLLLVVAVSGLGIRKAEAGSALSFLDGSGDGQRL
jgi:hypothetical protein